MTESPKIEKDRAVTAVAAPRIKRYEAKFKQQAVFALQREFFRRRLPPPHRAGAGVVRQQTEGFLNVISPKTARAYNR